jgi:CO/xanthine dehydrogenase FAD-binding subunit
MSGTFVAAGSLEEALDAMAAGARPVAGGTDLVVGARSGVRPLPEAIVAIHALDELRSLRAVADCLRAGALVTHAELASDPVVAERYTALADASAIVGSHATRAQGTIGGNVMNASPAMDTGGPLLCFGATATLGAAGGGSRELPLDELWTGPGGTSAQPGELLTAVTAPPVAPGTGSAYVRLEYRRQMEIAVVGATAVVELDGDVVRAARIAITALAPTIRRVPEAEAALAGTDGGRAAAERAAGLAAAAALPITDVRGSLEYRRAMAAVIARRAIVAAVARARDGARAVPIPASPALHGAA